MTEPTFWPWWISGLVVASVGAASALLLGRPLGVSGLFDRLTRARSAGAGVQQGAQPVETEEELALAMLAATDEAFGPQPRTEALVLTDVQKRELTGMVSPDRATPTFLVGIVLGGLLTTALSGERPSAWSLGATFDMRFSRFGTWSVLLTLLVAGVLIGVGTRMAAGCTSGHGISGVALGCRGSLLSTAVFWSTAVAISWLLLAVLP